MTPKEASLKKNENIVSRNIYGKFELYNVKPKI